MPRQLPGRINTIWTLDEIRTKFGDQKCILRFWGLHDTYKRRGHSGPSCYFLFPALSPATSVRVALMLSSILDSFILKKMASTRLIKQFAFTTYLINMGFFAWFVIFKYKIFFTDIIVMVYHCPSLSRHNSSSFSSLHVTFNSPYI